MSLRETAAIAFSSALVGAPLTKKQDALAQLLEFIEFSEDIDTVDKNGVHILETIYSLFVSFAEESQLAKSYRLIIAIRDLSLQDTQKISALGFDIYYADGLRLVG